MQQHPGQTHGNEWLVSHTRQDSGQQAHALGRDKGGDINFSFSDLLLPPPPMLRHRQAHDAVTIIARTTTTTTSTPPANDDPFNLFESPLENHGDDEARRAHGRQQALQRCCSRKSRRLWLGSTWLLILTVMFVISWRIIRLLNHENPNLLLAERNSLASPLLPVTKSFVQVLVESMGAGKRHNRHTLKKKPLKKILYLNNFWDIPHFQFGEGHQPFLDANCPVSDCMAVQDQPDNSNHYRASFDAVLIHAPDFDRQWVPEIQEWRHSAQRFVYVNVESPMSYPSSGAGYMNDFFNWTMTYRQDSDVPRPYGFFQPM